MVRTRHQAVCICNHQNNIYSAEESQTQIPDSQMGKSVMVDGLVKYTMAVKCHTAMGHSVFFVGENPY